MSAVSASWLYRRHAIRFYTHDVHLSPRHHRPARAEGKVSDGAPGAGRADERSVIQVYRDNNLLGRNAEQYEAETEALRWLEVERRAGRLEWVASRRTANELEKAPIERQEALEAAYDAATRLGDDHTVKGFSSVDLGAAGFVTTPLVEDVPDERIFAELREMRFDVMDARHLTFAIHKGLRLLLDNGQEGSQTPSRNRRAISHHRRDEAI